MDNETLIKILKEKDDILKKLYMEKEKLDYYATTDIMTGTLNRTSGLEMLNKEFNLSKVNDKNLIVCFIDVDKLKIINVAKVLRESIRKTDFIVRMGEDKFLIVISETTMKEVNKVWYRICRKIEEVNINSNNYNLSLSYGFYEYSREMQKEITIKDLIKKADVEMYKKKMKKRRNLVDVCINYRK